MDWILDGPKHKSSNSKHVLGATWCTAEAGQAWGVGDVNHSRVRPQDPEHTVFSSCAQTT